MRLIVASASPRRHALLAGLGLTFDVRPADVDEAAAAGGRAAEAAVLAVVRAKADAAVHAGAVVLTADTIVVLDGAVLGKPGTAAEARVMLERLGGRAHRVLTAVCVAAHGEAATAVVESAVRMRAYTAADIDAYVAAGGGLDKAGAYGIQDEPFRPVEAITGCWCNVMGLPLWTARTMLREAGVSVPVSPAVAYDRCAACPLRAGAA